MLFDNIMVFVNNVVVVVFVSSVLFVTYCNMHVETFSDYGAV